MICEKKLRRLLRQLVVWALTDGEPTMLVNWDINTGRHRFDIATGVTVTGARDGDDRNIVSDDPYSRRAIINTIKSAQRNGEL